MTGKMTGDATLAAIEAGRGVQIWAAEKALGQTLLEVLKPHYSVTVIETVQAANPKGEGAILLLPHSPAEALCRALRKGEEPTAAGNAVLEEMTALLNFQRRHRRRVVLLDQAVARHDPQALLQFCGQKSGKAAQEAVQAAAGEAPSAVMMVLAQVRLQADPMLSRLAGEFAAAARILSRRLDVDPDAAFVTFLQEQEELALLRDQQRSMYEQMETLYSEKQQLEQRLEQTRGGMESFQAQSEAQAREIDMLKGRLAGKDEVVRAAGAKLDEMEQIAAHQALQAAEVKAALQAFHNSRSYRMTAPLRGLRRMLRGRG